jgi:cobalt-precorrin-5B (C1)-methyltransferase
MKKAHNKQLRTGYTTGSCAAGASAAAAWMLINQEELDHIAIDTPKGIKLTLKINNPYFDENRGQCSITKDAGDDPDITHGMEVFSEVRFSTDGGITIEGGKGVGRVTLDGLRVPVGKAAINPTPLAMIEAEIRKIIPEPEGVSVVISIPEGEVLAQKTFNPRLGIVGGLSILGTTGIVEPMSEDAIKETIRLELNLQRKKGHEKVVLVPGNMGEKMVSQFYPKNALPCVIMSNYLGETLEYCVELGFREVFVAGHIGKLIKPAAGIYNTHNRVSSTRMEILVAQLALLGMEQSQLLQIDACITTDQAVELIDLTEYTKVYALLAEKAAANCRGYCFDQINVEFALFNMTRLLGESQRFKERFNE